MEDIFKNDFYYYSKKLAFHKIVGGIVSILTLGIMRNNKNIQFYFEKYRKSKEYLSEYNVLINKADELDKLLDETFEIEGVRISKHAFADVDTVCKADYPIDWDLLRDQVLQRDNYECQENDGYCNNPLQVHHIMPLSKGGTNELTNLITLCKYHHCSKHSHMRKGV